MSELLNGDTDDSSGTWDDKTKGFVFTGVNMSFAWLRVILALAARQRVD